MKQAIDFSTLSPRTILGIARARVCKRHPYFTSLLFRLRLASRPGIGTVTVDDGFRLFYDPAKIVEWGVEFTPALLAHEIQHLVRKHTDREKRARASGLFERYNRAAREVAFLWPQAQSWKVALNIAYDLEINDEIDRAGWIWPPTFEPVRVSSVEFGFQAGKTGEFYLDLMLQRAERRKLDDHTGVAEPSQHETGGTTSEDDASSEPRGRPQANRLAEKARPGDGKDEMESPPEPKEDDAGGRHGDGESDHDQESGEGDETPGRAADPGDGAEPGANTGTVPNDRDDVGQPGAGSCGGCAGNALAHEAEVGESMPAKATEDEIEGAIIKVADEVRKWESGIGRGVNPGHSLMEWSRAMLTPPTVNAMVLLNKELRAAIAGARGRTHRAWGKPSRLRHILAGLGWGDEAPLMAVWRGPRPRVVIVLDRSGSMGWGAGSPAAKATSEAMAFVRAAHGDSYGLAVDSVVQAATPVRTADDLIKLSKGGGGTDMRIGIKAAAAPDLKADVIILLTDGYTPWPAPHEMPKMRVVTIVVAKDRSPFDRMPKHLRPHAVFVYVGKEDCL